MHGKVQKFMLLFCAGLLLVQSVPIQLVDVKGGKVEPNDHDMKQVRTNTICIITYRARASQGTNTSGAGSNADVVVAEWLQKMGNLVLLARPAAQGL